MTLYTNQRSIFPCYSRSVSWLRGSWKNPSLFVQKVQEIDNFKPEGTNGNSCILPPQKFQFYQLQPPSTPSPPTKSGYGPAPGYYYYEVAQKRAYAKPNVNDRITPQMFWFMEAIGNHSLTLYYNEFLLMQVNQTDNMFRFRLHS